MSEQKDLNEADCGGASVLGGMTPAAWELLVRDSKTGWQRYNLYETEQAANKAVDRMKGEPLLLKVRPLYALDWLPKRKSGMTERDAFEAWMKKRGTPLALEHNQAFDAWLAAKAEARAAMVPALGLLKEYIDSAGVCDHAVGICLCGEYQVFDDAALALGWMTPNKQ